MTASARDETTIMPVTPFHYPITYLIHKTGKNFFSLPALTVGGILPDLECPFIFLLSGGEIDRLILHSFLGAIIIGLPLSMAILLIYQRWLPPIFHVDKDSMKEETSLSWKLIASALIGLESHVFIDLLHHPYNPLLYPFTTSSFNYLVLFGDVSTASMVIYILIGASFILLLIRELRFGRNGFWNRLLVK